MQTARWRDKIWSVTPEKAMAITNLQFSYTQAADNNNATEERQVTNERGRELIPLTFSTTLHQGIFPDVRAEIESWEKLVTKIDYFYLGDKQLGPAMQLRKVSVTNVTLGNAGEIAVATLNFEFKEYDKESSSVQSEIPPLQITATTDDKGNIKIPNDDILTAALEKMKVGLWVFIIGDKYPDGSSIPEIEKKLIHEISKIQLNQALLDYPDGLSKWVFLTDLSLA